MWRQRRPSSSVVNRTGSQAPLSAGYGVRKTSRSASRGTRLSSSGSGDISEPSPVTVWIAARFPSLSATPIEAPPPPQRPGEDVASQAGGYSGGTGGG